jgi:hypothetical protein
MHTVSTLTWVLVAEVAAAAVFEATPIGAFVLSVSPANAE